MGDPNNLEDYKGGRDYDSLEKFAQESLKPQCSPANIDLCDDEKKATIEKFLGMAGDELDKLITEADKKVEDAETAFKAGVEGLQAQYQKMQEGVTNYSSSPSDFVFYARNDHQILGKLFHFVFVSGDDV